jgi:hypothetical protein
MMLFVLFLAAALFYILFFVWCLAPLIKPAARFRKQRLLLAGFIFFSFFPILSIPSMLLLAPFGTFPIAITNLPMTLPAYVMNVWRWPNAQALTADVVFDFSVSGVKYSATLKVACTFRAGIDSDKAVLTLNDNIPTISGNTLLARVGSDFVALHFSDDLCHMVAQEKDEIVRSTRAEIALISGVQEVIDGKAAFANLDQITAQPRVQSERALTLEPVRVKRTGSAPAKDVMSMDVLWPMRGPSYQMGGLFGELIDPPSGKFDCARTRIMNKERDRVCVPELRRVLYDRKLPVLDRVQ